MNYSLKEFADRIESIMGEKNKTEWSKHVGLGQQTVSKWINNGSTPGIDKLAKISKTCGISADWLLFGIKESDIITDLKLQRKQLKREKTSLHKLLDDIESQLRDTENKRRWYDKKKSLF